MRDDVIRCSLTQEKLSDPVTAPCGHSFERNAIDERLNQSYVPNFISSMLGIPQCRCPTCQHPVFKEKLVTNHMLRQAIGTFNQTEQLADILICPIGQEIFSNPVMTTCGHSFEKENITAWLCKSNSCPTCKKSASTNELIPNHSVKNLVSAFLQEAPEYAIYQHDFGDYVKQLIKQNDIAKIIDILKRNPELLMGPFFNGMSLFHLAVKKGNLELVKAMMESFPQNINSRTQISTPYYEGYTPLIFAVDSEHLNIQLIEYLITQGADPALTSEFGYTPLFTACVLGFSDVVTTLIRSRHGLNVNQVVTQGEYKGYTALIAAIKFCHNNTVNEILSINGVDINAEVEGESALFIAVSLGKKEIVKSLLTKPNIDIEGARLFYDRKTLLDVAEQHKHVEIINLLRCYYLVKNMLDGNQSDYKLDDLRPLDDEDACVIFACLGNQGYREKEITRTLTFLNHILMDCKNTDSVFLSDDDFDGSMQLANQFNDVAYQSYYSNWDNWETRVRKEAFNQLENFLSNVSSNEKLRRLEKAKVQPVFTHRHFGFFKTNEETRICEMLQGVKKELTISRKREF